MAANATLKVSSPFRSLLFALIFSIVLLMGIIWHLWNWYSDYSQQQMGLDMRNYCGTLDQINRVFRNVAENAVEDGNLNEWLDRYREYRPEYERVKTDAEDLSNSMSIMTLRRKMFESGHDLLNSLRRVQEAIDINDTEAGLAILSDPEYMNTHDRLAEGIAEVTRQLELQRVEISESQTQRAMFAVAYVMVALPLLVLSWFNVVRSIRTRITHQAFYDALTGLPNRLLFHDRLNQAMTDARHSEKLVAILFLDLDRFNVINDTLGHQIGDLCLKAVAERLRSTVADVDTVARLGGDQFLVVLKDIPDVAIAAKVSKRIQTVLAKPFQVDQYELFITTSIGISMFPTDGFDLEILLKNAHTAMYMAKDQGRNCYQYFTQDMNAKSFKRLALENGLRKALTRDEFSLHYQPQYDIQTGRIIGMEALIRWEHPDLGMVYPSAFIPVAEETGLISEIGKWVLKTACQQTRTWMDAGLPPLRVAVNLSSRQFKLNNVVEMVNDVLTDTGLAPGQLELELTESVLMENVDDNIEVLHNLSGLGVNLSIDDFGTGYSSLSYLQRFSIDCLKIDRSFVSDIERNNDQASLTTAIIAMAHSLDLKVVAEGVETEAQLAFLKRHSCDSAQGYLFSRPLNTEDFYKLLSKGKVFVD